MRNRLAKRQSGFTLIEIAIVLVIIGILIVGVLQGQEMIENSKTKSIVNSMKGIQAAYNTYLDRYHVQPGDETVATVAARGWNTIPASGNGNGVLNIPLASTFTNNNAEGQGFWSALRASGIIAGDPADNTVTGIPKHPANGFVGVTTGAVGGTVYGVSGVFVCASGLSTKQAAAVDVIIDGPLPANQTGNDSGSLRGINGNGNPLAPTAAIPAATPYNEINVTNTWTVCMKIG